MAYNILDWPDGNDPVRWPTDYGKNGLLKSVNYANNIKKITSKDYTEKYPGWEEENVDDIPWNTLDIALAALNDAGYPVGGQLSKTQQLKEVETIGRQEIKPMKSINKTQVSTPATFKGLERKRYGFEDFFPEDDFDIDLDLTGDKQPKAKKYKVPKEKSDRDGSGFDGDLTLGDKIGMIGTTVGMLGKTASTIIDYLGDRPNENRFLEFAKDTLNTLHGSKMYAQRMLDYANQDIDMTEATAKRQSTQYARGINELRALQLGSHMQSQTARRQARAQYAATMLGLDKNIADVQLRRDATVMGAQERVDDKNKADRDAFYSNLSRDFADWGMYSQQLGRNLNQSELNRMELNLINQQSKYGLMFDEEGNLIESPSLPSASAPATVSTPTASTATPRQNTLVQPDWNPVLDFDYSFGYKKGNAMSADSYYYDPITGTLKRK